MAEFYKWYLSTTSPYDRLVVIFNLVNPESERSYVGMEAEVIGRKELGEARIRYSYLTPLRWNHSHHDKNIDHLIFKFYKENLELMKQVIRYIFGSV